MDHKGQQVTVILGVKSYKNIVNLQYVLHTDFNFRFTSGLSTNPLCWKLNSVTIL